MRKTILIVAALLLCSFGAAGQTPADQEGRLLIPLSEQGMVTVSDKATVNGKAVTSGDLVTSDTAIATGVRSSATIWLAKFGRVRLFPNTSIKLNFGDANISVSLNKGRVQVETFKGISAIVMAQDGNVVADPQFPATFMVDIQLGNMIVASQGGMVELWADGKRKAVAH